MGSAREQASTITSGALTFIQENDTGQCEPTSADLVMKPYENQPFSSVK